MGEHGEQPGEWLAVATGVLGRPGARVAGPTPGPSGERPADGRAAPRAPARPAGARIGRRLVLGVALLAGMLALAVAVSGGQGSATVEPVRGAAGAPNGMSSSAAPVAPGAEEGADPSPETTMRGVEDPASVDWWGVLAELDRRRADALQRVDAVAIEGYAVPGSPAWQADADLVASLAAAGVHPVGLSAPVVAIEEVSRCGTDACLVVVDRRSAYVMADSQGDSVEVVPAARAGRWRITLAAVAPGEAGEAAQPGWRVRLVEAMP